LILLGVYLGGQKPPAEKWVSIRQSLIFRVGGKIKKNK